MGRHAKPVAERIAEGTYRPHTHGPLDPGIFFIGEKLAESPPDCLDVYAREVWNRLYPVVTASNQVTENERELFVAYCFSAGAVQRAMLEIKKAGFFPERPKKKAKKRADGAVSAVDAHSIADESIESEAVSKWERVMNRHVASMKSLARLLGLTTVDRPKIVRTKTKEEKAAEEAGSLPSVRPRSALDRLHVG